MNDKNLFESAMTYGVQIRQATVEVVRLKVGKFVVSQYSNDDREVLLYATEAATLTVPASQKPFATSPLLIGGTWYSIVSFVNGNV